jgi:hypothetical protein
MTGGAVHRPGRLVIIGMFDGYASVATDAVVGFVDRRLQFGRVHKEGDGFAGGIGFEQGVVAVTIQTITVFDSGQGRERRQQECRDQEKTAFHALIFHCKITLHST